MFFDSEVTNLLAFHFTKFVAHGGLYVKQTNSVIKKENVLHLSDEVVSKLINEELQ